jgi:LmbE family N-acetylglucosaminyl deacetylase
MTNRENLMVLVVGAHPDDADLKAGGIACKYAEAGHRVQFLSLTNGVSGHHEQSGATLVRRRRQEARAAANRAGIEYDVLDVRDGELQPTLPNRKRLIRRIREEDPDLVLTHRPNDYHPDHRHASRLVQDAAYMVTVPNVCPETPALDADPVIAYLDDEFQKPSPLEPDAVVAVDGVADAKFDMLDCHESQVYEWLPYNQGIFDDVPEDETERRAWLEAGYLAQVAAMERVADRFRDRLIERYGEAVGSQVRHAEAFEGCKYGAPLDADTVEELFPFEPVD